MEECVWERKSCFARNGGDNLWQSFNPRQNTAPSTVPTLRKNFRVLIKESQSSFQRVKRCIEISPSVARPLSKSAKTKDSENSHRRELCFQPRTDRVNPLQSSSGKEVYKCSLLLIYVGCVYICAQTRTVSHTCNVNKLNFEATNFIVYRIADQLVDLRFPAISKRIAK